MIKMIRCLVLSLIVTLNYSCTNHKDENLLKDYSYSLDVVGRLEFELDAETSHQNNTTRIVEVNGNKYLSTLDNTSHSVKFYNLKDRNDRFKIKLHKDGPNAITEPMGFYFHNKDSIFIYETFKGALLVNSEGVILNGYPLGDLRGDSMKQPGTSAVFNSLPLTFKDGKVFYLAGSVDWELPIMAAYDLSHGNEESFVNFPKQFQNKRLNNFYKIASHTFLKNEILISFPLSDSLYRYSYDGRLIGKLSAKSDMSRNLDSYKESEPVPLNPSDEQISNYIKAFNESPSYFTVMTDESSEYIFRFCSLPRTKTVMKNPELRDFSIIVLNKKGEKLAEKRFDEFGDYMVQNPYTLAFVYEDSLYIQKESTDENVLVFEQLKLNLNEG